MTANQLYSLIPAIHRIRDAERGEPLKALLSVIGEQMAMLEEDSLQLYDDQFIETCADWAVPYIGDLIGVRALHGVTAQVRSPRAEVANTIGYRRRKGTAAMLEQLARDVTGWPARVVEFYEWLGWNQYLKHTRNRPPRGATIDLRDHDTCERITYAHGAFDTAAHTVDVHRSIRGRGRFNIPYVGLFLWRLQAYPIRRGTAREVTTGRYTFNPLGIDAPLFNRPQTESDMTHLAEETNLPGPLRRRPLYEDLEAYREALAEGHTTASVYFGDRPVLEVFVDGETTPVPPEKILVCDLGSWRVPPTEKDYTRGDGSIFRQEIRIAVDPVLGRLTFPSTAVITQLLVSYTYGFSGDIGANPYVRPESVESEPEGTWQVSVSQDLAPGHDRTSTTLREAVDEWNRRPRRRGVIAIRDNRTYAENLTGDHAIMIPAGSQLRIVAAKRVGTGESGSLEREQGPVAHLLGDLSAVGTAAADSTSPGTLIVHGLLIEGKVSVLEGNLGSLQVAHCTLAPGEGGLVVNASSSDINKQNSQLSISLQGCIGGPVLLPESVSNLRVRDSLLSSGWNSVNDAVAIHAPGADTDLRQSTIFGSSAVRSLEASNSIFTGTVNAARCQIGRVCFCYLPVASRVPRRYRCQPSSEEDAVRIEPQFTSRRYGDPGYGQLSQRCPLQIRRGAEDESEMGAFHDLFQHQREANLRIRLNEYLRFGLEAGIYRVT